MRREEMMALLVMENGNVPTRKRPASTPGLLSFPAKTRANLIRYLPSYSRTGSRPARTFAMLCASLPK